MCKLPQLTLIITTAPYETAKLPPRRHGRCTSHFLEGTGGHGRSAGGGGSAGLPRRGEEALARRPRRRRRIDPPVGPGRVGGGGDGEQGRGRGGIVGGGRRSRRGRRRARRARQVRRRERRRPGRKRSTASVLQVRQLPPLLRLPRGGVARGPSHRTLEARVVPSQEVRRRRVQRGAGVAVHRGLVRIHHHVGHRHRRVAREEGAGEAAADATRGREGGD